MNDLNPILISIGISMYILPAFAVLCTVSACVFIICKHRQIDTEYIYKYRLMSTYELQEDVVNKTINKYIDNDIEATTMNQESETTALLGEENV